MNFIHKVVLILTPHFGKRILNLAVQFHCWIVESVENVKFSDDLWKLIDVQSDPLESGITYFKPLSEKREEICIDMIETIMDHHSEFNHNPGLNVFEVIGVKLTTKIEDEFIQFGFSEFEITEEGFIAKIID